MQAAKEPQAESYHVYGRNLVCVVSVPFVNRRFLVHCIALSAVVTYLVSPLQIILR